MLRELYSSVSILCDGKIPRQVLVELYFADRSVVFYHVLLFMYQ